MSRERDAASPADRARVAAHWSDAELTRRLAEIHWMGSPIVRAHLNRLVSGDPRVDWLTWSWGRFVLPLARRRGRGPRRGDPRRSDPRRSDRDALAVLVLGCGDGWLERALAARPEVGSIDACDVAAGAVDLARRRALADGLGEVIRYHVVDLDRDPLPGGPWDVVVAHSVLHHVAELERCYDEIANRLRPGGLLLVNEYTGPRRFQFTAAQMAVINGILRRLPERLRTSAATGGPYALKEVPAEAELIATDPSEAVRSDEVVPRLRERFEILADTGCGGSVLHLLLYDVVQNFDPADAEDNQLLGLLCWLESALVAAGWLDSDYRVLVARRGRPGGDRSRRDRATGSADGGAVPAALPGGILCSSSTPQMDGPVAARLRIHSRPAIDRRHGLELEPVRRALHERVTGNPETDWIGHVLGAHRPAAEGGTAWVLGRQDGWLAARLRDDPAIGEVVAVAPDDPAPAGPRGPAAWIFTDGWLGLSTEREAMVARLASGLASGGLLVGDELVAPADGRTLPAVLRHARQLLELVQPAGAPARSVGERFRDRLVELEHSVWRRRFGPPRQELDELLGERFSVVEERPQLGALVQRVLAPLESVPAERFPSPAFLRLLCYAEELLTDAGQIEAERVCFAARRR